MSIHAAFRPMPRRFFKTPAKYRRIGARLAYRIPVKSVAYLFGVSTFTVYNWRTAMTRGLL